MAPQQTLELTNGEKTDDLKVHIELDGVFPENGQGKITKNVADETVEIPFSGKIEKFKVIRGEGSASIDGKQMSFADLEGYDTRSPGGGGGSNDTRNDDDGGIIDGETEDALTGGNEDGKTVVKTDGDYGTVANADSHRGSIGRPYSTQDEVEIHVGRGRGFESLQSAFNVVPHHVHHDVTIHVHGRTRDNDVAHIHNVIMANQPTFQVIGHDGAVINNGGVNTKIDAKMDHVRFDNLEFEMLCQTTVARFENCVFAPDADGQCCFSGKEDGKMLINCEFKPGADYCIVSIGNEMVEIRGCKLRANKAAVDQHSLSMHRFTGGNDFSDVPEKVHGGGGQWFMGGEQVN